MAIVINGDPLTTAMLQPGWTVVADGFGLNTSTTVFKVDTTFDVDAFAVKGNAHPDPAYAYLKLDKWKVSWDSLNIATLTVDYVGIDTAIGGGIMTNANTSVANGLTAQNITTHINFFTTAAGYGGQALAGLPADFGGAYTDTTLGPPVTVLNVNTGKPVVVPSSVGYNGACFETGTGGRFIGFVDPSYPDLYGKTQYLARTTTYSGTIYTTSQAYVQALYALLGTATASNSWGVFTLIPAWGPTGAGTYGNNNLLSQVNVEEFGSLYKVMYEIRYSPEGWPYDVYINI